MVQADPAIALEGITFTHPGAQRPLLADLDLAVGSGEMAAVLGPSGVGKSTLLNLAAGLVAPDTGRVRVLGTEVPALGEAAAARWRRRHLGFVFQQFHLLPHLTVADNVALPLALNGDSTDAATLHAFLDRLGLAEHAGAYPRQLSGGQAQRTAIARALIHRPAVLLADELTGNLDEDTAEGVLDVLTATVAELGATTLVVTHAPEVARRADSGYRLTRHRLQREW